MSDILLFSSDLDGTLLGSRTATDHFAAAWRSIPAERLPILVYNSGRLVDDLRTLPERMGLPTPDYLIGGVGTQLWDCRLNEPITEFPSDFSTGWDLKKVEQILRELPGITTQAPEFLHPYKSSWHLYGAHQTQIDAIRDKFRLEGLEVTIVYSSNRDLDILPANADKGKSLAWLCAYLGIPTTSVLVAGDSGNDSAMFHLPGVRGIVVENAHPELLESVVALPVFVSFDIQGDGVVQGLRHYGVVSDDFMITHRTSTFDDDELRALFGTDRMPELTDSERDKISTGYRKAIEAVRKCLSPLGFLAASLEDNEVTGTDENYRSVWARDGCITLINTILLDEPDLRATARATLETLLGHVTPNGQVPSNVSIDTGKPDYSGIGGIASIDSGLWLILACYHFVRVTSEVEFLNEHLGQLQRAMDWLSAHDSNNNGLIEIPEAGDWTDLFGRSYNVLYDEVLWFRANVCFGRLLSFAGHPQRAADYLRTSQRIKQIILEVFWPSTKTRPGASPIQFADRQFSLGDSPYLLAQVSPFGFDWRCDILGNILASLMNVLDYSKAMVAFRFMWGIGANSPYPVTNLYPPVQSGDPDWKSYYLVNLLNLPHHYHNGGIWPFIGGMWVRFIDRLGLRDVAAKELVKLADLNRLGTRFEWEFNEWAHGVTGRPMGKRFQAWSAACFVRACQELHWEDEPSGVSVL